MIIGGVVAIMIVLTLGAADLGTALIARERAHAAADAAALAAAQELAMPSGSLPQIQAADYAESQRRVARHLRLRTSVPGKPWSG